MVASVLESEYASMKHQHSIAATNFVTLPPPGWARIRSRTDHQVTTQTLFFTSGYEKEKVCTVLESEYASMKHQHSIA